MRREIHDVDRRLVELVAKRLTYARRIGDLKRGLRLPIRDYRVEAEVISDTLRLCRKRGIDPAVGENLMRILIAASVDVQKGEAPPGKRRRSSGKALIIGGRGRMGRWFADYLNSRGMQVSIHDPRGAPRGYAKAKDLEASARSSDVVMIATPMAVAGKAVASIPSDSKALTFDICSLKTPVASALRKSAARGLRVTSLHPMWGPTAGFLSGKNLVVASVGKLKADRAAEALFSDTAVRIVRMGLEEHDEYMAYVLGLAHATSLAFSRTLEKSGHSIDDFADTGGPTFQKQLELSREVSAENPDLYREIQALNPQNAKVYSALVRAIEEIREGRNRPTRFRRMMEGLNRYYGGETK